MGGSGSKKRSRPEIKVLNTSECQVGEIQKIHNDRNQQIRLAALYDYESRQCGDLSFKKNDEFLVKTAGEDWTFVRSMKSGEEGYIPSNYVGEAGSLICKNWYFGPLTRKDSERLLLRSGIQGSFLIRKSETSQTSFSLSLVNEDLESGFYVKHYRIRSSGENSFSITEDIVFKSLEDLIEYYKGDSHGLCCQLRENFVAKEVPQTLTIGPNAFPDKDNVEKSTKNEKVEGSEVFNGSWNGSLQICIKPFSANCKYKESLPQEVNDLVNLQHTRLLKFFGVIYPEPVYLVWEHSMLGNLLYYLRHGEGAESSFETHIDISAQIASGMAYLEEIEIVHNNLRAENIMVNEGPTCKLIDYGISDYEDDSTEALAKKTLWSAPEHLLTKTKSIKSDVWSFAVTVTEIIQKGNIPYFPQLTDSSEIVRKITEEKYRMPRMEECPENLYEILLQCWDDEADMRPTFEYIQIFLENFFAAD